LPKAGRTYPGPAAGVGDSPGPLADPALLRAGALSPFRGVARPALHARPWRPATSGAPPTTRGVPAARGARWSTTMYKGIAGPRAGRGP